MPANVERFRKDLDRLIQEGDLLEYAMLREVDGDSFKKQAHKQLGEEKGEAFLKSLPDFKLSYEAWYSESLALLRQILPDRVADLRALYEKPKGRKSVEYGNYVIQDYMQNLSVTRLNETVVSTRAAVPQFRQQLAILKAAKRRFEPGFPFSQ
jgi:hypothetical protein